VIVLNILCDNGHHFEGWFASSDAFREQRTRALVTCPHCHSAEVSQLPSAPHVLRGGQDLTPTSPAPGTTATDVSVSSVAQAVYQKLAAMARQAENVGERFPEEARRIHYDEAPARTIRGIASQDETRDLLEEGIMVLPAPVPPESETH
jgi:hypothetical protein